MAAPDDETVSDSKLILRPLVGLMNGLERQQIERFVVEEIEKHRRLRDEATRIETILGLEADAQSASEINHAYISALIAMHAQQTVVSTLLDILGYIPDVPKKKSH